MSDDTPTVRLPESQGAPPRAVPAGAAPTRVLPTAPFERPPTRQRPERPSRGPVVLFVILAVLVVAALVVLLVVLDGRLSSSSQPATSSSPTPQTTEATPPAPAKTTAPPPVTQPAGSFTTFTVPQVQGGCGRHGRPTVMVTWATANATSVWIASGTGDAKTGGGTQLPTSGDQSDIPESFTLDCSQQSNTFTMTLVGDDGADASKTWTVAIGGRHFGHG